MENMNKTKEMRQETFTSLMRKAERDVNFIYPLAIAIAYSNLKTAIDPERRTAKDKEEVSNSGADKKLTLAKKQLYFATLQLENLYGYERTASKKTIVKRFDSKAGKIVVSVKAGETANKPTKEDGEKLKALILNQTIDGVGLELVQEIAISLLESMERYGDNGEWLEKDVSILKPKKTFFVRMDERQEMKEQIVKPIQLAFRAGSNFINAQRAVRDRVADTVYLDAFRELDGDELPNELKYEHFFLKAESVYDSVGDIERQNAIIARMNLTTREAQVLKWLLDGMDVFALDEETGKRVKIHIDNPTVEVMAARLEVSEKTAKRTKASIAEKACAIGFKPERMAAYNESKAIEQVNPVSGEVVAVYATLGEAARKTGLDKKNIHHVLRGEYKRCGGYFWRYDTIKRGNLEKVDENTIREHF